MDVARTQAGASLPEVLLVLALAGVMLTGLLAAQWQARGLQQQAWARQQVVLLLDDLGERMRLNAAATDTYREAFLAPLPAGQAPAACLLAGCPAAARARADLAQFASQLRRAVPTPAWALHPCVALSASCLVIAWQGVPPVLGASPGTCADEAGQVRPGATCLLLVLA